VSVNPITLLKLGGLAEAAKTIGRAAGKTLEISGSVGGQVGKALGSEAAGKAVGYAAPVMLADYATKQYGPSRRARAWLGQQAATGGTLVHHALVPGDFGTRPGDYGGGGY
jgi:hypothetical protein